MKTLSELLKEISSLPKGNLYAKRIGGKEYWYHQYFESGKRYTSIVRPNELEGLREKIALRKALEKEYKERTKVKATVLSSKAREKTGDVMLQDTIVASFQNGSLTYIDKEKAPLVLLRTGNLDEFLKLRVIDSSRTNARLLKKALGIKDNDDSLISLTAYACCISDSYWFKPKHSKLKYKDTVFQSDAFADVALKGDMAFFPAKARHTPELTTSGSFEKGWRKLNGHWWLYKQGTKQEIFSELFCFHFASLLGIPSAVYEYDGPFVRTKNFAEEYDFEPMASLVGDDDNYETVFKALSPYPASIKEAYLLLMLFDAVVNNVDRHNENYGLLRDKDTGRVISLAPNFDCNLALISRSEALPKPGKDGLIKLFLRFVKGNKEVSDFYAGHDFRAVTKNDLRLCVAPIPEALLPKDIDSLIDQVIDRFLFIVSKVHQ